ncbi:class I SAM-dependent methyltransferase [Candidatus Bathyarchaeota archaeon]|nr:MAG: class I SAM-dependent methyltransferase [Candidatus Bathyarchaeota archaeon]
MSGFPDDFIADLRWLKAWPSILRSPWRQPYLAGLTFGETLRLVNEFVTGQRLKILDVGCGRGWLSLELSREGHYVLGLDSDPVMIEVARRSMESDPEKTERGSLEHVVSDFSSWKHPVSTFDLIIFSRVLHHVPKPESAVKQAHSLLRPGGRIICVEHAYDQFDRRGATWFYHVRRTLEHAGWYSSEKRLSENADASITEIMEEWFEPARKEHFNRFDDMVKPLRKWFLERSLSWEPYIYWDILTDMYVPDAEAENAVARSVYAMERALVDTGAISPVLFCFVGDKEAGWSRTS